MRAGSTLCFEFLGAVFLISGDADREDQRLPNRRIEHIFLDVIHVRGGMQLTVRSSQHHFGVLPALCWRGWFQIITIAESLSTVASRHNRESYWLIILWLVTTTAQSKLMASCPTETQLFFTRAVLARLAVWPVLRVAVESSWGGPESKQKRLWMVGEVIDAFENASSPPSEPDETYIEEMLLQMMADEFDCMVEDLSGEEVAADIVKLWKDTKTRAIESSMMAWEERERKLAGKKIEFTLAKKGDDTDWIDEDEERSSEESGEGEEEAESMDVDEAPTLVEQKTREPIVDEEGFTLVQGKGKGKGQKGVIRS